MLIDTSVTMAYKCSACGSFEFKSISVFDLNRSRGFDFKCRCERSSMEILNGVRTFKVVMPCIACGEQHILTIEKKKIISSNINIFYCPQTGIQFLIIGNDLEVRRRVDKLEMELDDLMGCFGYDNYFKNSQVMLDSLNRIHDIAEEGNLYCECGCDDIELILLSDKIQLMCKKCLKSKILYTASNEDLKDILTSRKILIGEGIRF